MMTDQDAITADLRIPFPSTREAEIAYNSLRIDKEPKRSQISRSMQVEGNVLAVRWTAKESRNLRVSVNSFMDHLGLVIDTLDRFGPPKT